MSFTQQMKLALLEAFVDNDRSFEAAIDHIHRVYGRDNCPSDQICIMFINALLLDDDTSDSSSGHNSDMEENESNDEENEDHGVSWPVQHGSDHGSDNEGESDNDIIEQSAQFEQLHVDPSAFEALKSFFKDNPEGTIAEAQTAIGEQDDWVKLLKKYFINQNPMYIRIFHHPESEHYTLRKTFADRLLDSLGSGQISLENLVFADYCTFNSHRSVQRQTYKFFGHYPPYYVRLRWHPIAVKIYAAMSLNFLIINFVDGSTSCDDDGSCLIDTIKINFNNREDKLWYVQDGNDLNSTDLHQTLRECFDERVIGFENSQFFGGGIVFPPNSPFISPCDFFLWGHIRNHVYRTKITSLVQLREAIVNAASTITPEMRREAIRATIRRLEFVRITNGEESINVYM